jgi:predicted nucleotidyltransferase
MSAAKSKPIRPPTQDDIRLIVAAIAQKHHPERVVLFGSRAYGKPRDDSDVDLLVILPFEGSALRVMSDLLLTAHEAAPAVFSMDVLAERPDQLSTRYGWGDPMIREAVDKGLVLYEAAA